MEENVTIQKVLAQPSVKLNHGITGGVGWEIKLYANNGENVDIIINKIKKINDKLSKEFANDVKERKA